MGVNKNQFLSQQSTFSSPSQRFLVILSYLLPFTSNLPLTPNFSCFLAVDILLSITALAGNFLIFVALHKESSLHPPSKLLHRCLATTDLFNAFLINKKNHSYSVLKNWMSCWFVYQQFSRPKITKMDQKLICKHTYKPIFEKSAIWKNIWNSLCIYVFSFLITKCLFWWEKKRYIYLIYFQIWEVFKNRYLHICIKPKETQSF